MASSSEDDNVSKHTPKHTPKRTVKEIQNRYLRALEYAVDSGSELSAAEQEQILAGEFTPDAEDISRAENFFAQYSDKLMILQEQNKVRIQQAKAAEQAEAQSAAMQWKSDNTSGTKRAREAAGSDEDLPRGQSRASGLDRPMRTI